MMGECGGWVGVTGAVAGAVASAGGWRAGTAGGAVGGWTDGVGFVFCLYSGGYDRG